MKSLYDFIIQPIGDRYANSKKIGKKDLILNTKVESWKHLLKKEILLLFIKTYLEDSMI